jgi:N-acetylglucosaminyldiphosphoundecaprenol N-acetyl-beta-D-mannosaminyltransferase
VNFYGTTVDVLQGIVERAEVTVGPTHCSRVHAPPVSGPTPRMPKRWLAINVRPTPDLLFVALLPPRQERWMAAHQG